MNVICRLLRADLLALVFLVFVLLAATNSSQDERLRRARTARALADMQELAIAIEAYRADWNAYPLCNTWGIPGRRIGAGDRDPSDRVLERISTPVAYVGNSFPPDPHNPNRLVAISHHATLPGNPIVLQTDLAPQNRSFYFISWDETARTVTPSSSGSFGDGTRPGICFMLQSSGPDQIQFAVGGILANFNSSETQDIIYDPTNGSVSYGSIFQVGGAVDTEGYGSGFQQGVYLSQGLTLDD